MTKTFAIALVLSGYLLADSCETMLEKSIQTTDTCLNTLYSLDTTLPKTSFSASNSEQIKSLRLENESLKKENKKLKSEVALIQGQFTTAKQDLSDNKFKYNALLSEFEQIKLKTLNRLHSGKGSDIQEESRVLNKKYQTYTQSSLIEEKAYRVPTHSLNIRKGSSGRTSVEGYLKQGDLVRFFNIQKHTHKGKDYYWLQTRKGWIYVSDGGKEGVKDSLEKSIEQIKFALSMKSKRGGAKG